MTDLPLLYPDDGDEYTAAGVGILPRCPDRTEVDDGIARRIAIRSDLEDGPFLSAFYAELCTEVA